MATENKNLSNYDEKTQSQMRRIFGLGLLFQNGMNKLQKVFFKGAFTTLIDCGALPENIVRWNVPGSFELIFGAKQMHEKLELDAVIVVGCVIKGETMHFEFVCEGVTHGIKDLNIKYAVPTIFCVLTDNTMQQSIDRSGGKHGNKGVEAAIAALKMIELNKNSDPII